MTKQEAAIVATYTGIFIGDFGTMHQYIEKLLGRPVFIHELANLEISEEIKNKAKADFCALSIE